MQEEIAAINLAKYRKVQHDFEEAEERADQAEQSVTRLRSKHSSSSTSTTTSGGGGTKITVVSRCNIITIHQFFCQKWL